MQTIQIENDTRLACERAASFPEGVLAAHQQLHQLVPFDGKRNFYGISWMEEGLIQYMAAVEIVPGDIQLERKEPFLLRKGTYLLEIITDFRKDIAAIGRVFGEMIQHPGIDLQGVCVEWYPNMNDVHCMVRLAD